MGKIPVSVAGLGCNNFGMTIDQDRTTEVVRAALNAGINYYDTADIYGGGKSEEFLGVALGSRRKDVIVATKFGTPMNLPEGVNPGSEKWARTVCEQSLRRLGTDYIDHYQLHRPDDATPLEETLGALDALVKEGKVIETGVSNFSAAQLHEMADICAAKGLQLPVTVQNHYSALTRTPEKDGVLAACDARGVKMVPFFPLESGVLTGKYTKGNPPPEGTRLALWGKRAGTFLEDDNLDKAERLAAFAVSKGHTLLELALSWMAGAPHVATVIAGATRAEQITANVAATSAWKMTADERAEVDRICGVG